MRPLTLAALAGLLCATATSAELKSTEITIYNPDKGNHISVTVDEKATTKITINGAVKHEDEVFKKFVFVDDFIEVTKDSPEPVKVKRTYSEARIGTKKDSLKELQLSKGKDKPILIKKSFDKDVDYIFKFEDGDKELDEESQAVLNDEFNVKAKKSNFRGLLPKNTVTAGRQWNFDPDRLRTALTALGNEKIGITPNKTKVTGVLKKIDQKIIDKKDDKKKPEEEIEGDIEITIKSQINGIGEKSARIPATGELSITYTATGRIDGKSPDSTSTLVIKLQANMTVDGASVGLEQDVTETRIVKRIKK